MTAKTPTNEEIAKELVSVLPKKGGCREGMFHDILHVLAAKSKEAEGFQKRLINAEAYIDTLHARRTQLEAALLKQWDIVEQMKKDGTRFLFKELDEMLADIDKVLTPAPPGSKEWLKEKKEDIDKGPEYHREQIEIQPNPPPPSQAEPEHQHVYNTNWLCSCGKQIKPWSPQENDEKLSPEGREVVRRCSNCEVHSSELFCGRCLKAAAQKEREELEFLIKAAEPFTKVINIHYAENGVIFPKAQVVALQKAFEKLRERGKR